MGNKIKVHIADDHQILIDGVKAVLNIEPDIEVPWVTLKAEKKKASLHVFERDLKGHLANGNGKKDGAVKKDVAPKEKLMTDRLAKDVQLQRALDVLKAMHVVQQRR